MIGWFATLATGWKAGIGIAAVSAVAIGLFALRSSWIAEGQRREAVKWLEKVKVENEQQFDAEIANLRTGRENAQDALEEAQAQGEERLAEERRRHARERAQWARRLDAVGVRVGEIPPGELTQPLNAEEARRVLPVVERALRREP